jgi:hypothetical protein
MNNFHLQLSYGWPAGVEPARDMFHKHARLTRSRHGHTWSTPGYSKTHAADYGSAALPLELEVQTRPSVKQILSPLLFGASHLAQECARGL